MKEYPFTDEGYEEFRTFTEAKLGHNEHARIERLGWTIIFLLFQIGGLLEKLIQRNERVDEQSS